MNSENPTPTPPDPNQSPTLAAPQHRLNWLVFFAALLAPAAITFFSALSGNKDAPVVWAFVGSGLGGIVCGVLLGRRFGKTTVAQVLLGILFTFIFAFVCFVMSFFGCMAGGFKVDMR